MNKLKKYYYLFFFSLAFDFRGVEDGGSFFQFALFLMAVASGLVIILGTKPSEEVLQNSRNYGFFLVVGSVLSFIYVLFLDVEIGRHIRVAFPFFLLILGYFVGIRLLSAFNPQDSVLLMLKSAMVAIVFNVFYGFATTGVGLNEIRYQILSPMMFIAIPGLCYHAFILQRKALISSSLLFVILMFIFIGATRSWLIAFFGVATVALMYRYVGKFGMLRGILGSTAIMSILMIVITGLLYLILPESVDRMVGRVFESNEIGFDITSAARVAEADYQFNAWLTNVQTFLLGNGIGAIYGYSGVDAELLFRLFGDSGIVDDWWAAGHNFWIYSLFSQGALFGLILPLIIVRCLFISTRNSLVDDSINKFLSLVFISFFLSTIGGNPMGSRMLAQYIGMCIGLLIAMPSLKLVKYSGGEIVAFNKK